MLEILAYWFLVPLTFGTSLITLWGILGIVDKAVFEIRWWIEEKAKQKAADNDGGK